MGKRKSKKAPNPDGAVERGAQKQYPPFLKEQFVPKVRMVFGLTAFLSIISALCLLIVLSLLRKANPDVWFHLKTGEVILETLRVPTTDIFSFTAFGRRWITHEWLSEVVFILIHKISGETGLSLSRVFFTLLPILVVTYVCIRRTGHNSISLLSLSSLLLLFGLSSWDTFVVRPHLFSWLWLSLWLSSMYAIKHGKRTFLNYLLPVQLLWANMHGSAILGPFLLFLLLVDLYVSRKSLKVAELSRIVAPRTIGLYVLACAGLCFFTPNTWHMVFQPLSFMGDTVFTHINEWKSPFHSTYSGFFFLPYFMTWLILIIVSTLANWNKTHLFEKLSILFFVYLSLKNQRNISLSFIALIPVIHFNIIEIGRKLRVFVFHHNAGILVTFDKLLITFLVLAAISLLSVSSVMATGIIRDGKAKSKAEIVNTVSLDVDQATPNAVAEFIDTHDLPGPIRNSYEFGGYFIWRLYPKYKVFFDGRADVYGEELFERFFIITPQHFYEDLMKYGINTVAMKMTNVEWVHNFLLARGIYAPANKHTLVFFDDFSCVYVKNATAPRIVEKFGFQFLHPALGWQKRITAENFEAARKECERAINSSQYHSLASKYLAQLNNMKPRSPL